MEHRHARQRDVHGAPHAAVAADDDVLDVVEPLRPGVHHGVHLAGAGIELRMRGEPAGERPEEVVAADAGQFAIEFHRTAAGLDDRPDPPGVRDDVRVGPCGRAVPVGSGDVRGATRLGDAAAPDVAVAVPLRATAAQAHAVDHAVAEEPVVGRRVGRRDRIRAVAQVESVELDGQFAHDRQVGRRDLLGHRGEVALEIGVSRH